MKRIEIAFKNQWKAPSHYVNMFDFNIAMHNDKKGRNCSDIDTVFFWLILFGYQMRIRFFYGKINKKGSFKH